MIKLKKRKQESDVAFTRFLVAQQELDAYL